MSQIEQWAREYVDLANAHDVASCETMFAADAQYDSTGVGAHRGRVAIGRMMADFFARVPDVHWHTDNWRGIAADGVAFDFHMMGQGLDRRGTESIWFDTQGLIRRIEVRG